MWLPGKMPGVLDERLPFGLLLPLRGLLLPFGDWLPLLAAAALLSSAAAPLALEPLEGALRPAGLLPFATAAAAAAAASLPVLLPGAAVAVGLRRGVWYSG